MVRVKLKGRENYDISELFNPVVQVFDDTYHEDMSCTDSIELKFLKSIRRRYVDPMEFDMVYKRYIRYIKKLIRNYGGKSSFEIALLSGRVSEYIPPIPKLKNSKRNRAYSKYGILFSTNILKENSSEDIEKYMDDYLDYMGIDKDDDLVLNRIKDNKLRKSLDKASKDAKKMTDNSLRKADSISFIEQYFFELAKKEEVKNNSSKKEKDLEKAHEFGLPISAYFEGNIEYEDKEDLDDTVYYKSVFITKREKKLYDMIETFGENGWDAFKIWNDIKKSSDPFSSSLGRERLLSAFKDKSQEKKTRKIFGSGFKDDFLASIEDIDNWEF